MSMLDFVARFLLNEDRMARLSVRAETQEDFDQKEPVIQFLCEPAHRLTMPEPKAAYRYIPKWWKKIPPHVTANGPEGRDQFGGPAMTAKKCLPLLDGMGLGYTLVTAVDIHVRTNEKGNLLEVRCGPGFNGASQHSVNQLGGADWPGGPGPAIKFHNPWVIKTRPGYSTLFIPPMNAFEEERFTCLGAVVDTDTYPKQINFPAIWRMRNFDGVIPAGTPLVTAIPFKRSEVPREFLIRTMHVSEKHTIGTMERIQASRNHMYTDELRDDRKGDAKEPSESRLSKIFLDTQADAKALLSMYNESQRAVKQIPAGGEVPAGKCPMGGDRIDNSDLNELHAMAIASTKSIEQIENSIDHGKSPAWDAPANDRSPAGEPE